MKPEQRKSMIAKIHIAKAELGLCDETYRAFLMRETGKSSCKDINNQGLAKVLHALKKQGFIPKSNPHQAQKPKVCNTNSAMLGKVEALLADHQLPWNYAHSMAKQMFGIESVQWLHPWQLHKLVAALQIYANRKERKHDE